MDGLSFCMASTELLLAQPAKLYPSNPSNKNKLAIFVTGDGGYPSMKLQPAEGLVMYEIAPKIDG